MIFLNFVERRNHPVVPIFNLQFWEILPMKKPMFRSEFMYIPWIGKYWKSKRIKRGAL